MALEQEIKRQLRLKEEVSNSVASYAFELKERQRNPNNKMSEKLVSKKPHALLPKTQFSLHSHHTPQYFGGPAWVLGLKYCGR